MRPGARVLELAANDGSLIRHLQMAGFECAGVDPAVNIVMKAQDEGLPIHCGYWPDFASQLDGEFDAIICMNVVAHVDDPLGFLIGCKDKLAAGGIILVQPSQARMFENCEFDTIYHEHLSFFNTNSMSNLARRAGLRLVESLLVKIHGDSPIYVLQHQDAAHSPCIRTAFSSAEFLLDDDVVEYENRIKLYHRETYTSFSNQARQIITSLIKVVSESQNNGYDVVFVGAAAKAMTVINAAGIKPKVFLDENPLKIGFYAPGCGALIGALEVVRTFDKPTLFIMSAWNFRYELAAKLRKLGVPEGSKFFAYFPKPESF
jgi:SAM-dependent methyltransferase